MARTARTANKIFLNLQGRYEPTFLIKKERSESNFFHRKRSNYALRSVCQERKGRKGKDGEERMARKVFALC